MVGAVFDCLSRFNVSSVWGRNLSHNFRGKFGSIPANMEMKWVLKFLIAASAIFLLWQWGGTSSNMHSDFMSSFIALEHSLSRTCFLTSSPVALALPNKVLYATVSFWSVLFLSGTTILHWHLLLPLPSHILPHSGQ